MKYSKLSTRKIGEVFYYFFEDFSATQTAKILNLNRNTVNLWYNRFREAIVRASIASWCEFGEFEIDESYFGAKRIRWKRWRWAAGKTPIFGILKRDGKVYVNIVKDCSRDQLLPIIEGKILEWSTIHSDGWKAYDGLILNGYDHYRVYHSKDEFVRGKSHINGIESFWSFAKRRLRKFNGVTSDKFHLHLKECEFRYNYRDFQTAKKIIFKNLLV